MKRRCAWRGASWRRPALAGLAAGLALLVAGGCAGRGGGGGEDRDACGFERAGGAARVEAATPPSGRGTGETRPPRLINRDHIMRLMFSLWGPYRRGPLNVDAAVCAYVPENGVPSEVRLAKSAGAELLDSLAVQVAWAMRFEPALVDGEPVAVWVRVPVVYRERAGRRDR